jgi:hypothetical protein
VDTAPMPSLAPSGSAAPLPSVQATEPSAKQPDPPPKQPDPPPKQPDAPPPPSASAEPPLAKGELSLERKAADAVASNDFAKAADLYDQLAKQHPDKPAYARAAEILRKKVKK